MPNQNFFSKPSDQSRVKVDLVEKYFSAWSKIMLSRPVPTDIAFVDLYSSPGYYEDGTKSVPLIIIEKAIENAKLRSSLITLFNDKDKKVQTS